MNTNTTILINDLNQFFKVPYINVNRTTSLQSLRAISAPMCLYNFIETNYWFLNNVKRSFANKIVNVKIVEIYKRSNGSYHIEFLFYD